jgi:hypothetical protein
MPPASRGIPPANRQPPKPRNAPDSHAYAEGVKATPEGLPLNVNTPKLFLYVYILLHRLLPTPRVRANVLSYSHRAHSIATPPISHVYFSHATYTSKLFYNNDRGYRRLPHL